MKHLIRHTVEHFIIVEGEDAGRCLNVAKNAARDDWTTGKQDFTVAPTCGKFTLGESVNSEGDMVPAWGFDFGDVFVYDAKDEGPAYYDLTQDEVDELDRLNAGRGLL